MTTGNEIKAAAYKTVECFSSIVGKKIYLKEGFPCKTSGYLIVVPFEDPCFYQRVEKGIAHILFRSNATARDSFVFNYVDAIEQQVLQASGTRIQSAKLRNGILYLLGLLEDERVLSLWGQLYSGSEALIREYRKGETEHLDCRTNFLNYATKVFTGNSTSNDFEYVRHLLVEASNRVRFGSFQTTLVTTKWLVVRMVDLFVALAKEETDAGGETPNFEERVAALDQLAEGLSQPPKSQQDKVNEYCQPKHKSPNEDQEAHQQAVEAINTDIEDPEALEQKALKSSQEMQELVTAVQAKTQKSNAPDDGLSEVDAKLRIIDVLPNYAEDSGYVLTELDTELVTRMRAYFFRIMGRRKRVLDDSGEFPDIGAAIQRRVTRSTEPVFSTEGSGRGFEALLLLDRSASMNGEKTTQCDRARKILELALKFPFVKLHVWGFNSPYRGYVDITRFEKDVPSLNLKTTYVSVGRATPLHVAIEAARKHLKVGSSRKHIFVLTDGAPIFCTMQGFLSPAILRKTVRTQIDVARKDGIGVTTLVIPDRWGHLPDGLTYYKLGKMLGPDRTWRVLKKEDGFGTVLHDTVIQSFSNFLRYG